MLEFVHKSVERKFHVESARLLVKNDFFGTSFHLALASAAYILLPIPQSATLSGGWTYYAAFACGAIKIVPLVLICIKTELYLVWRDTILVVVRIFDTICSLALARTLHVDTAYPMSMPVRQFYFKLMTHPWFGAVFGAVSKQPPSDINFIFILISFLGGVLSYKTYLQALGPHYAKLTPAVRWLRDKSLGDWTEETFLQATVMVEDVVMGMLVPCFIVCRRELSLRKRWRRTAGLEGTPEGVMVATWWLYLGPALALSAAAFALAFNPALLPYIF